ncbi:MAG: ATP-binding protein [Candidatus Methanoplasma sp.]|jgi:predicted AAA+ superfamily ATPase|nr:ATP-binding protein [Candidatus Methanoplasma sp.]
MAMTRSGYRPRIVDGLMGDMLRAAGAVCIEGPKWCGKTWVALNHAESAVMIGDSAGNFQNRRLVEMDVSRAFRGREPRLIDEWQDVPEIWDAVKSEVDESNSTGRFILTGSSTPRRGAKRHSGAGRIGIVRMRTMSLFESGDSDGSVSLGSLFRRDRIGTGIAEPDLGRLADMVVRGGWPNNVGKPMRSALLANASYLSAITDDASSLDGSVRDKGKIGRLIRSLARNEGTTASLARIASDMAENRGDGDDGGRKQAGEGSDGDAETASQKTARAYMDVLDRMFLLSDQPAFDPNVRSKVRVGKAPKRHLADPSIAAAAMGLTGERLIGDLNTFGFLFESMCERDLDVYASAHGGKLYHYRDGRGNELDAVIEMPDGRWGAFEIKLGENRVGEAARNLERVCGMLADEGARPPEFRCVVCGTAAAAYVRPEDGAYVVPITSLRE